MLPLSGNLSIKILFSGEKLVKLHRGIAHRHNDKLMNLLKPARPIEEKKENRELFAKIFESCHTCQKHASKPKRFKSESSYGIKPETWQRIFNGFDVD